MPTEGRLGHGSPSATPELLEGISDDLLSTLVEDVSSFIHIGEGLTDA
jgi:hypothetical protein